MPGAEELATWNQTWSVIQRLTLMRLVSEALTNVLRHSGGTAILELTAPEGRCHLRVVNSVPGDSVTRGEPGGDAENTENTGGIGQDGNGYGLLGLAERLRLAGGTLTHGATTLGAGPGFVLEAEFPVSRPMSAG